jgi:hypothetical protein
VITTLRYMCMYMVYLSWHVSYRRAAVSLLSRRADSGPLQLLSLSFVPDLRIYPIDPSVSLSLFEDLKYKRRLEVLSACWRVRSWLAGKVVRQLGSVCSECYSQARDWPARMGCISSIDPICASLSSSVPSLNTELTHWARPNGDFVRVLDVSSAW